MVRSAAIAILLTLTGALIWGCSSPTDDGGFPDPSEWEIRDSPQHVLQNLIRAYEHKDAVHYLDCLAEDFTFWANPYEAEDNPALAPGYWDKAEEITIHGAMFGENGAETIALTLTQDGDPMQIEGPEPGDPPEWQYTEAVDLRVYVIMQEGPMTFLASAPSLFRFREDADELGPNGETLWEIVSWHDLSYGGAVRGESTSWAAIKCLYR
jgi:hypothetical protein